MNNNTVPYVYLVGWTDLDKYYIGVKYKKGSHPRDFWVKYFTSSKVVHEFRKEHGEPDIIMIIREHETAKDAAEHEDKLLRRLHAVKSDRFLNRSRQGVEWNIGGCTRSDETKAKMSKAQTGRILSDETKVKLSKARTGRTQPLVTCPHCGKVGGASTMKRWHFDDCKQKPVE